MGHSHAVRDSDARFSINAITRAIHNGTSRKLILIQGDHNSERFTFEIPRYVEGHDMTLCNAVEVHYINIDSAGKVQRSGVYTVINKIKFDGSSTNDTITRDFSVKFAFNLNGGGSTQSAVGKKQINRVIDGRTIPNVITFK